VATGSSTPFASSASVASRMHSSRITIVWWVFIAGMTGFAMSRIGG
jgi:hypothetical protein